MDKISRAELQEPIGVAISHHRRNSRGEHKPRDEPLYFIPAMNFFNFGRPSQPGAAWHPVGLASALPDLSLDNEDCQITQACKAFTIPKTAGPQDAPVEADINLPGEDLKDQVLVFKYKGKVHAIDHVS